MTACAANVTGSRVRGYWSSDELRMLIDEKVGRIGTRQHVVLAAANALQRVSRGDCVVLNTDGAFTYTANGGYSGADSFTYRVSDGFDYSNVTTVNIQVISNQAPVAADDAVTTTEDTATLINVLTNDSDADHGRTTAPMRRSVGIHTTSDRMILQTTTNLRTSIEPDVRVTTFRTVPAAAAVHR
jgi:hypothetical protein